MKSWILLLAALVCGALVLTLMVAPQLPLPNATFDVAMVLAAVLLLLPSIWLGFAAQIIALVGFARR